MLPYRLNLSEDEVPDVIMFGIPKSQEKEMHKEDLIHFKSNINQHQPVEFCNISNLQKTALWSHAAPSVIKKGETQWFASTVNSTGQQLMTTSKCTVIKKLKASKKDGLKNLKTRNSRPSSSRLATRHTKR